MAGIIEVKDQGKLRIYDADNSHYIDIVVPSSVTANRTITIPDASFTVPQADTNTVYTHPNHSGEVTSTSDGATVIADNIVDEANLKISNSAVNGYMLTAQSGNTGGLTWAAAPSAGLNVITSSDISDNTSLLNNDGNFSSTYDLYYVVMSKVKVSGNTSLFLRFNQSGSGLTANYSYASLAFDGGGNERRTNSNSDGTINFASNAMIAGSATHNLSFYITDPLNAIGAYYKVAYGQYGGWTDQQSNSALVGTWSGGYHGNTNALSGFQIATSNSATFDTGNITLYGVKTT